MEHAFSYFALWLVCLLVVVVISWAIAPLDKSKQLCGISLSVYLGISAALFTIFYALHAIHIGVLVNVRHNITYHLATDPSRFYVQLALNILEGAFVVLCCRITFKKNRDSYYGS